MIWLKVKLIEMNIKITGNLIKIKFDRKAKQKAEITFKIKDRSLFSLPKAMVPKIKFRNLQGLNYNKLKIISIKIAFIVKYNSIEDKFKDQEANKNQAVNP